MRSARPSTTSSPPIWAAVSTTWTAARCRSTALPISTNCAQPGATRSGLRFVLPVTAGFFDFTPVDVLSEGPPTRVDSISLVPGFELDYLLRDDWHFIPYARAGLSFASSSVGGILYGAGVRLERRGEWHGWDQFLRAELTYAGVEYRHDVPADQFVRLRHGVDVTRGMGFELRGREPEIGLYAIFDAVVDPPTAPVAEGRKQPIQAEFGVTLSYAAPAQDLALRRAAHRLRLPVGRRIEFLAFRHRRAVLICFPTPRPGRISRTARAAPRARV